MGIQTMNNSWLSLTLDQVRAHLANSGKLLGNMNLDELLKNVWATEATHSPGTDAMNSSPAASLQRQASWSLARAFGKKTVDEVWRDIQQGYRTSKTEGSGGQEREPTLGETTLEDFLVKAGMYVANPMIEPVMSLDSALKSHKLSSQMQLSPSPSIDAMLDMPILGRKRIPGDLDKAIERRLRRKIKNRESAARSRARKQAYHNELVTKVSYLEEENTKLKNEK
ncbi:ABSCISIC ACID-INSENSITIVE 5-like protein 2 isoform X2 [Andrographis paniculata]|nr:ABSCISIC ACID-INSENSITIVE 5-like protein 2 isoform X2 [Andrographis paniculata]